jgi:hypothetical protein
MVGVIEMEKAQEIIKHIFELYLDDEPTDDDVLVWCEKNMERYRAYEDAFKDYDTVDVLKAIDEYWRYTSNKTKPTVAKLLTMLNTNKAEKKQNIEVGVKYFCIERDIFKKDIELGRNTNCFYPHYVRAVDYILDKLLPATIGMQEFLRIKDEDLSIERGKKYKLALENGLFNKFDEILQQVARGEI